MFFGGRGFASILNSRGHPFFLSTGASIRCAQLEVAGPVMNQTTRLAHEVYEQESVVFQHATLFLYEELLKNLSHCARKHGQFLKEHLSNAHFDIGRILFRQQNYLEAVKNLAKAGRLSPSIFASQLVGSWMRHRQKAKRSANTSQ